VNVVSVEVRFPQMVTRLFFPKRGSPISPRLHFYTSSLLPSCTTFEHTAMGKGKKSAPNGAKSSCPTEESDVSEVSIVLSCLKYYAKQSQSWTDPRGMNCADNAEEFSTWVDS
jgi:hypothetical protein